MVLLVRGFNPFEKVLVKLDHFPNFRSEHKTSPTQLLSLAVRFFQQRQIARTYTTTFCGTT